MEKGSTWRRMRTHVAQDDREHSKDGERGILKLYFIIGLEALS